MAYQSLYRRYRSRTFDELVGQQHVVTALRNAITEDRVGHAYLFSGPRGTGKTSTARILGKALNCTNLGENGEPCCACDSCLAFESGTSYDLQELDAASNNGVDAIRDLISRVAVGSPGRTKVYILDEVHMLTAGAENALLKTLEEPPEHVVFVLATTEPHKVVPTIRSRTQHFEFELIPAEQLEGHVRWVAADAGLTVDDAMVDYVLRVGGGSARDTLSALDQVVAAGGVPRDDDAIEVVIAGLAASDPAKVVMAVSEALKAGRDPRVIGETVLARLRDAFLSSMGAPLHHLSDGQAVAAADVAQQMGPAVITRALELVGACLIDMRQAPDPRVDLEVALLRLTRPELDTDLAAVLARLERLERGGVAVTVPALAAPEAVSEVDAVSEAAAAPAVEPSVAPPIETPPDTTAPQATPAPAVRPADGARAALNSQRSSPEPPPATAIQEPAPVLEPQAPAAPAAAAAGPRPTLGATRGSATPAPAPAAAAASPSAAAEPPGAPSPAPTPAEPATAGSSGPELADLQNAWDDIRADLPGRAKSRFSGGRFTRGGADGAVFGLPNAIHRDRCQECVADVAAALSRHFGVAVSLTLEVDDDAVAPIARAGESGPVKAPSEHEAEETVDLDALVDAAPDAAGGEELLTEAFPGAEFVEQPDAGT